MARRQLRRRPMSEINVVPYIDVMLVLLVIFMVTAPLLTQGVVVELPKADAQPVPDQQREPMVVSVDVEGRFFLDPSDDPEQPLALADVAALVGKVLRQSPEVPVYVRGDQGVAYGEVVRLMAALQGAGASGVGLITEAVNAP